jgi:hypothetical protein
MADAVDLPFTNYPGGGREPLGRPHGDVARRGDARALLDWCGRCCAYCGLDMSNFEGWLQLSVDHVVPQQTIGLIPADWVLDRTNLVACCRSCNDLFNRDPGVTAVPTTPAAFFDLRDASFLRRRERIVERRAAEKAWFEENVLGPHEAPLQ